MTDLPISDYSAKKRYQKPIHASILPKTITSVFMKLSVFSSTLLTFLSLLIVTHASAQKIRLLTNQSPNSNFWENLELIGNYLESEHGIEIEYHSAPSVKGFIEALHTGQYALIYTSPYFYSLSKVQEIEIEPFIAFSDAQGQPTVYYSCFIVPSSSQISSLEELLKQKKSIDFRFSSPTSTSGHMIPRLQLALEGIKLPEMYFKSVGFSSGNRAVKQEVGENTIDAASCSCSEKGFDNGAIKSIWSSPPLLRSFLSVTPQLDKETQEKIRTSLLHLHEMASKEVYDSIVSTHDASDFARFTPLTEKPLASMLASIRQIKDLVFFISYYQDRIKSQQKAIADGEKVLKEQKELMDSQFLRIQNQSTLLYIAFGGFVLALIAFIYIYLSLKQRKKLSNKLREKSEAIEVQNSLIAESMEEISNGMKNQMNEIDESSELVGLLRRLSFEIKDHSASINETANSGFSKSEMGTELNNRLETNINQIHAITSETMRSAEELNDSLGNVSQILILIKDIVRETNMLSINARIEAARAGTAGKGFSVVAQEIIRLADRSTDSVVDVEKIIEKIQNDSKSTVSMMEKVKENVEQSFESSKKAKEGFESTKYSFGNALEESRVIRDASERQFEIVEQVVAKIEKLVTVSENTAVATKEAAVKLSN